MHVNCLTQLGLLQRDTQQSNAVVWGYYLNGIPNIKETTMDTRSIDLQELSNRRDKARNAFERDLIDRTIDKIMRESGAVRRRREDLIMAVRNGDNRAINRFQHELNMMQAEETKGREY